MRKKLMILLAAILVTAVSHAGYVEHMRGCNLGTATFCILGISVVLAIVEYRPDKVLPLFVKVSGVWSIAK